MEKIIEYLNTGSCIALIGAGPSCEIGLPSWNKLAQDLFTEIKSKKPKSLITYNEYLQKRKYPEFFGLAVEEFGKDFVYRFCKARTTDNKNNGKINRFLSKFPFQAYFTTNFDESLLRHLREEKISSKVFLNRKKDFQEIDIDILKKLIVKIHGDFSDEATLILTDKQYLDRESDGSYKYYRDFLRSYFSTKRFLIVGYSVTDPDIQRILKDISTNLRRTIPIYAIIADADNSTVRDWDIKYNIQVINYKNISGNHKELVNIFSALENYISLDSTIPPPRQELDLKKAQSFYMWHRFQAGDESIKFKVDALKSIILYVLCYQSSKDIYSTDEIIELIFEILGLGLKLEKKDILTTLKSLVEEKYLSIIGDNSFQRNNTTLEIIDKYNRQYDNLKETFENQIELDFASIDSSINENEKKEVIKAINEVFVDLFVERGVELVNMIFSNSQINIIQAKSLFKLIHRRSKSIARVTLQYTFIKYITDMLSSPSNLQSNVLEYYSKAYFAMQALQVDPLGQKFRNEYLKNRTFIVDSSILIPLLAICSKEHNVFEAILKRAKECDLKLITTERLVQEVIEHARWALIFVEKYGEQSEELLSAALGRVPYKRNLFIDGFINYSNDVKKISFENYIHQALGDYKKLENVTSLITKKYNINIFQINLLFNDKSDAFSQRDQLYKFIENKAIDSGKEKSNSRSMVEAESHIIIYNWQRLKPIEIPDDEWKCSFLSQGGFLNRIAIESDFKIESNVVVKIEALYEFLMRFSSNIPTGVSFNDVLLSSYFRSADYFIDKKKYEKFFQPLINEAERIYNEGVDDFKKHINEKLTTSSLDDYFDLEKPIVVKAYEKQLREKLGQKEIKIQELEENLKLKEDKIKSTEEQLGKYIQKEKNKEKYAKKQRREQERKKRKNIKK